MKQTIFQNNAGRPENGFTLVELLAIVAMVAFLAVLLIPAMAATRPNAQAFQCQNNEKQLTLAWQMYAGDNQDLLPPNDFPYTTAYLLAANKGQLQNWAVGTMEQPTDSREWQELVPTTSNFHTNTCLAGYITNASTYRCPADQYIDPFSHAQHVRSYSVNNAVGTLWNTHFTTPGIPIGTPVQGGWLPGASYNASQTAWLTYGKMTSFTRPGPANTFLIIDENPFTINDGNFDASAVATPGATYLIDYPAANHGGAACISFVDGHVVVHKWLDVRTTTPPPLPIPGEGTGPGPHQTPDNPDCFYLAPITSAAR
jgi:prepilin-type processing-associated H-X9-DG protein